MGREEEEEAEDVTWIIEEEEADDFNTNNIIEIGTTTNKLHVAYADQELLNSCFEKYTYTM